MLLFVVLAIEQGFFLDHVHFSALLLVSGRNEAR